MRKPNQNPRTDAIDSYFNYNLRENRLRASYTTYELAELVGITHTAISFYERLRAVPGKLIVKKIAIALRERTQDSGSIEDYIKILFPERLKYYVRDIRKERKQCNDMLSQAISITRLPKREMPQSRDDTMDSISQLELEETLKKVIRTLPYREREVIRLKYGLEGGYTYSLEEVGHILGVTGERIRQIKARAIKRLQKSKRLIDFLD